jgi:predicted GNAT superfamily acetyltransferase
MSEPITVRACHTLEEFRRCMVLQQEIWGEEDLEIEPSTTFVVAANTGGQVLGAFEGDRLVGFTLALVGLRQGTVYLHSHMTGVDAGYWNRGVGRMLKLFQRDEALARGIRLIEWTFDPLEMRNAHFNLNRLGAIARRYVPNLYGVTTSPLHLGLATDRLVAEWHLDSVRVMATITDVAQPLTDAQAMIEVPVELEQWKQRNPEQVRDVQARVREQFGTWFARGYAAVGVRRETRGAAYLLIPWSDF